MAEVEMADRPIQNFLIRPYERLGFAGLYVGVMAIAGWVTQFVLTWLDRLLAPEELSNIISTGLLAGSIAGLAQWLVIRRYLPNPLWISITTLGVTASTLLSYAQNRWVRSYVVDLARPIPPMSVLISWGAIGLLLSLAIVLLTAYAQSRVLRSHVRNAKLWLWVPILIAGVEMIHLLPLYLQRFNYSQTYASTIHAIYSGRLNINFLINLLRPLVTAIAFCSLLRKSEAQPEPLWLQMPDIRGLSARFKLWRETGRTIARTERPNPETTMKYTLSYLVGVNQQGEFVGYQADDRLSTEQIDGTPLPQLVADTLTAAAIAPKPVAKFRAIFNPLSGLMLLPLIQVSRRKLAIGGYFGLLLLGVLAGFLTKPLR